MARDDGQPTLNAVVRELFDDCGRDPTRTVDHLVARVKTDPAFRDQHLDAMAREWADRCVRSVMTSIRSNVVAANNPSRLASALELAGRNEAVRLMDMPIWGGKRLGDATPPELDESALNYAKQSKDMAIKSRFQARIADLVRKHAGEDATVAQAVSAATLQQAWDEING